MASLNTNLAAMTALRSLTATNMALNKTQDRVSTGLRVGTAADNAAYWSIATTMRSDNSALSTVQDALGLGAAVVDVAYTALEAAIKTVTAMKDKLTAAAQPGLDRAKIQTEITELQASACRYRHRRELAGPELAVGRFERRRLQLHEERRVLDQPRRRHHLGADDLHRHHLDGAVRCKCRRLGHSRHHARRGDGRGERGRYLLHRVAGHLRVDGQRRRFGHS